MKRIVLIISVLLVLLLISLYIFLPKNINISPSVVVKSTKGAYTRMLMDTATWEKWIPKDAEKINRFTYSLNDVKFSINFMDFMHPTIKLLLGDATENTLAGADIKDSLLLTWVITSNSTNNLLDRIRLYNETRRIKKTTSLLLNNIQQFLKETKNVYGINIERTTLQDSTLISTKAMLNHYPTINDVYGSIALLEQYANSKNALAIRPPMLHIVQDDATWNYMVALPINKDLPNNGNILSKRMLAGGNFLATDIIMGGFNTVDKYNIILENFRIDQSYISPAIPFQSLITDRRKESDTTKWQTKLYYPIF